MSYLIEHFQGNWFEDGLRFAGRQEAEEHAQHLRRYPYRVTESGDPVNYTWDGKRLHPYKAPVKSPWGMSWADYLSKGGGNGIPCRLPQPLTQERIEQLVAEILNYYVVPSLDALQRK